MALLSLSPGNYLLPFIGTSAATIAAQAWFTAANADVYAVSANGASYAKNAGGSNQQLATFTQFVPTGGPIPSVYILVVRQSINVDGTLFGNPANVTQLVAAFPAAVTGLVVYVRVPVGQGGTYILDPTAPATGLTGISYSSAGSALTFPATLAAGALVLVTGTTQAGTEGAITFAKQ